VNEIPKERADWIEPLRRGDYRTGWPLFEARSSRLDSPYLRSGLREWRGEPLANAHLVVVGEQGIGDEIQFGRFVPRLKALGARITAAVLPMNQRLFGQLGADVVLNRMVGHAITADFIVGLMSLPLRLGCFGEADFGAAPYLRADAPRTPHGVGVVWRGQPRHENDRNRSMPSPDLLLALPGATLVEPCGDTLDSLDRLSALEALVTVDTSWAHLGGALGSPTHLLLPAIGCDWRWGEGRADTPWYGSVRLYRQPRPGDWETPLAEIRAALSRRA
jgi:hypothetical protein